MAIAVLLSPSAFATITVPDTPATKRSWFTDSLRRSSVNIGTMQRRLAWPLRKDDTHKSRSIVKQELVHLTEDAGTGIDAAEADYVLS